MARDVVFEFLVFELSRCVELLTRNSTLQALHVMHLSRLNLLHITFTLSLSLSGPRLEGGKGKNGGGEFGLQFKFGLYRHFSFTCFIFQISLRAFFKSFENSYVFKYIDIIKRRGTAV